jgi:WD40 repeat protein
LIEELKIRKRFTFTGHNAGIYSLCRGIETNTVLSGSADKFVAQWNLEKGEQHGFSAKFPAAVYSLLPMYEQDQLWVGTGNGHIHIIDTQKKEEVHSFKFHQLAIFDLKFSPELNLVFSSGADGILNVYNPQTLKHVYTLKLSAVKLRSISFRKNEIILAEGSGKTIILDGPTLQVTSEFESHKQATNCYLVDEENDLLYSGGRDAHLNIFDIKNNYSLLQSIPAHNFAIYKIISLTGTGILASASRDKTFKLWDERSMKVLARIDHKNFGAHTHSVNTLLWNEQLGVLTSASDDRSIMAWEILL